MAGRQTVTVQHLSGVVGNVSTGNCAWPRGLLDHKPWSHQLLNPHPHPQRVTPLSPSHTSHTFPARPVRLPSPRTSRDARLSAIYHVPRSASTSATQPRCIKHGYRKGGVLTGIRQGSGSPTRAAMFGCYPKKARQSRESNRRGAFHRERGASPPTAPLPLLTVSFQLSTTSRSKPGEPIPHTHAAKREPQECHGKRPSPSCTGGGGEGSVPAWPVEYVPVPPDS